MGTAWARNITSGRFLFYELEGIGVVSKEATGKRRPDQDMSDALTRLREVGAIPWDMTTVPADERHGKFRDSPLVARTVERMPSQPVDKLFDDDIQRFDSSYALATESTLRLAKSGRP